jgi:TonB-dependent SusC/RagA subfamily outer membrane receptor
VYVTQNTGAPGGGISVNIRGVNSINGSNEPLYVVDGVQIQGSTSASGTNPLSSLNPADVLSMEILQGPSATAIYGSRGTNGVVLITTKRGKIGDIKISYGLNYSIQTAPHELDVMNLRQYAQMENEYKAIAGGDVMISSLQWLMKYKMIWQKFGPCCSRFLNGQKKQMIF